MVSLAGEKRSNDVVNSAIGGSEIAFAEAANVGRAVPPLTLPSVVEANETIDLIAGNPLRRRAPNPTEKTKRVAKKEPPPPPTPNPTAVEVKAVQSRTTRLELQKRIRDMQEKAAVEKSQRSKADPLPVVKLNGSIIEYPLINKYKDIKDNLLKPKPSPLAMTTTSAAKSARFTVRKFHAKIKVIRDRKKPPPPTIKRTMVEAMNPGMNLSSAIYTGAPTPGKKRVTPAKKREIEARNARTGQRANAKIAALKENDDARQVARNLKYKTSMVEDGVRKHLVNIGLFDDNLLRMNSPVQDLLIPPNDPDVIIGHPIPEPKS